MNNTRCWACRRNQQEIKKETPKRKWPDEGFFFIEVDGINVCLFCWSIMREVIEEFMKEKFGESE